MAPAFPQVLTALAQANSGEEPSYGFDSYTERVTQVFSRMLSQDVGVRWTLGGTGANVLSMALTAERHEGIVVSDIAHMVENEAGAPAQITGAQFHIVPSLHGKLANADVRTTIKKYQHPHCSRPAVLSLTQATEVGTVYTIEQVRKFADLAHEFDMYLHIDGARIANALVALDATPKQLLSDTGVDIVSFGATKAGTLLGEAVVVLNPKLQKSMHTKHVATGQTVAKGRFIAAQYEAYLQDDLWLTGARNANEMAQLLAKQLTDIPGYTVWPCETNMVFADVDKEVASRLRKEKGQIPYEEGTQVMRWVAAWDTTADDINELVESMRV